MTRQIVALIIALLLHTVALYAVSGYLENNSLAASAGTHSLQITISGNSENRIGNSEKSGNSEEASRSGKETPKPHAQSPVVTTSNLAEPKIFETEVSESDVGTLKTETAKTEIVKKKIVKTELKRTVSKDIAAKKEPVKTAQAKTVPQTGKPREILATQTLPSKKVASAKVVKVTAKKKAADKSEIHPKEQSVVQQSAKQNELPQVADTQSAARVTKKVKVKKSTVPFTAKAPLRQRLLEETNRIAKAKPIATATEALKTNGTAKNKEAAHTSASVAANTSATATVNSSATATVNSSATAVANTSVTATANTSVTATANTGKTAAFAKLEANYRTELVNAISRYKRYPMRARKKGNEGDVVVAFTVEKDGLITKIVVVESSSWVSLDKAAVRALEKLNRFKPIPDSLVRSQWSFQIPIKFSLQS